MNQIHGNKEVSQRPAMNFRNLEKAEEVRSSLLNSCLAFCNNMQKSLNIAILKDKELEEVNLTTEIQSYTNIFQDYFSTLCFSHYLISQRSQIFCQESKFQGNY